MRNDIHIESCSRLTAISDVTEPLDGMIRDIDAVSIMSKDETDLLTPSNSTKSLKIVVLTRSLCNWVSCIVSEPKFAKQRRDELRRLR